MCDHAENCITAIAMQFQITKTLTKRFDTTPHIIHIASDDANGRVAPSSLRPSSPPTRPAPPAPPAGRRRKPGRIWKT